MHEDHPCRLLTYLPDYLRLFTTFDAPQRLYDVLFSFTFTVPTLFARTALDAIR